jgi:hypothetical protein
MKRIALIVCAVVGLSLAGGRAQASWGQLGYSGYQPWWNIFAKRYKCLTPEEERLQKFWHDYYDALKHFYCALDAIDWVAYYKNHGYQINAGCGGGGCCGRINYAPVFVSPNFAWAMPGNCTGPAAGPGYGYPGMGGGMCAGPGGYPGGACPVSYCPNPMAGPPQGYPMYPGAEQAAWQGPCVPMTMPMSMPMPHGN